MAKIHILSEEVANQIAAGEVVERPASVVKELLDNALDAGAKQVKVEAENGGIKKLVVMDDGEGMDKEDLEKCYLRHGTSKIATSDDLWRIQTLGFRGEALSSITAVSKLTIRTRTKAQSSGLELVVEGSKRRSLKPVGMPVGTTVMVEDLFAQVPARRKFLKTTTTELRHITEMVIDHALGFPDVGWQLKHQGRLTLNYPKTDSQELRVKQVLGEAIYGQLIPIHFDHPHLQISGLISKPQISHETKYKQYLLVNHRRVTDRGMVKAVKDAYGNLLPPKVYPVFVLYLNLPFEMVDVNVHPRKEEVKFVNGNFIYNSVRRAVSHALEKADLTFEYTTQIKTDEADQEISGNLSRSFPSSPTRFDSARRAGRFDQLPPLPTQAQKQFTYDFQAQAALEVAEEILPYELATQAHPIIQIHNLYLVTQTDKGLLIVDQHAAHERILYDQLVAEFKAKKKSTEKQSLLIPAKIDLPADDRLVMEEQLPLFSQIGFDLEIQKRQLMVQAVPALLTGKNITKILSELIEDLKNEELLREVDDQSQRMLTFLACRSAVKAGDRLTAQEAQEIVNVVKDTKTQYTCPHGRPVKVEMSLQELEKMFKRSGFKY